MEDIQSEAPMVFNLLYYSQMNRVKIGVVRMTDRKTSEAGCFGNLQVRCA